MIWACPRSQPRPRRSPGSTAFVCDLKESQYGDGLHIFGAGLAAPNAPG
jgi:hypothetical protein